ncbi:hypothetical protein [Streptomyces sp. NRRL S-813]|uniref:hypothetical protein n=1 Tax=Streptomyces sp. NRRL S-813 TaxID=1463919 RepID=UPI00099E0799|nr:hypothetical protein [Streptomyces sp. NRRL S-813]
MLAPWRKPQAVHDPGKILLDVALAATRLARSGDVARAVAFYVREDNTFMNGSKAAVNGWLSMY